jgi:8-oxo-dGTP diphosphatase
VETDEADPFWVRKDAIPYPDMWADDVHWIPGMLRGGTFRGYFTFEGDRMLAQRVEFEGFTPSDLSPNPSS